MYGGFPDGAGCHIPSGLAEQPHLDAVVLGDTADVEEGYSVPGADTSGSQQRRGLRARRPSPA
ncbi:hypothetical protein ABZ825_25305 [Streptomyces tauricus]|uniref:hypothetical protein n=1 Tax=Streptomyces tauricus TaxID=68274 RepID=UPI0033CAAD10